MSKIEIDSYLKQTAEILIKYSSFIPDIGLYNGKMGIAIFLYRYARYSNKRKYKTYANELIDDVIDALHINTPAGIDDGISGIRFGFDYLSKNGYINIKSDDYFESLNDFIEQSEFETINEKSYFYQGLYWVLLKSEFLENSGFEYILDKIYSKLKNINSKKNILYPKMIQSLLYLVLECCCNKVFGEKSENIFNELETIIKNKLYVEECDGSIFVMFSLCNKILQLKKIKKEYNNSEDMTPSFFDVLFISKSKIIYKHDTFNTYENKLLQIVESKKLINDIFYLINLHNLSLNNCLTGLGWSLLDHFDK